MVEQDGPSYALATIKSLFSDIDPQISGEELLHTPHAELLGKTFQALNAAYKSRDFQTYDRVEAEFVRQFGEFWRYRMQKYIETVSTEEPGFCGRYSVKVGAHLEEMGVTPGLIFEDSTSVNLHIFRVEPGGKAWDSIDFEGFPVRTSKGDLYSTVILDTTISDQVHPMPCKFHLELTGGKIKTLQRITVQYHPDEQGRILGHIYTEAVGHTSGK